MGAATLAYVRSSMTQEVTVCRTLIPLSELIVPYQFQDTRRCVLHIKERVQRVLAAVAGTARAAAAQAEDAGGRRGVAPGNAPVDRFRR